MLRYPSERSSQTTGWEALL